MVVRGVARSRLEHPPLRAAPRSQVADPRPPQQLSIKLTIGQGTLDGSRAPIALTQHAPWKLTTRRQPVAPEQASPRRRRMARRRVSHELLARRVEVPQYLAQVHLKRVTFALFSPHFLRRCLLACSASSSRTCSSRSLTCARCAVGSRLALSFASSRSAVFARRRACVSCWRSSSALASARVRASARGRQLHVAVADAAQLRTFVLDRLGNRKEIAHLQTSLVYEHRIKPVVQPISADGE